MDGIHQLRLHGVNVVFIADTRGDRCGACRMVRPVPAQREAQVAVVDDCGRVVFERGHFFEVEVLHGPHTVGRQGVTGVDHGLSLGVEVQDVISTPSIGRTQDRRSVDREVAVLGERIDEDVVIEFTADHVFHEAGVRVWLFGLQLTQLDGVCSEDVLRGVDDIHIEDDACTGEAEVDRVVTVDVGDHVGTAAGPRFHQEHIVAAVTAADAVTAAVQEVAPQAVTQDVMIVVAGDIVVAVTTEDVFDAVVVIATTGAGHQTAADIRGGAGEQVDGHARGVVPVVQAVVTGVPVQGAGQAGPVTEVEAVILRPPDQVLEVGEVQTLFGRSRNRIAGDRRSADSQVVAFGDNEAFIVGRDAPVIIQVRAFQRVAVG
ncbi:hypothetical protein V6x_19050 [Gimesia chilikensis]|uniref:Uncharacterized protein n=1 Tax=Gimesia chilikensis TaxID=2605989 RepID=A0A517WAC0_9PLAN|nr:hypothetical protein V6x_19050 [Gimesia chilikensis]